ncbi:D-alanyl-D-alanine carboxypeptidase [Cribrihabitans marinus]|uniref:D-alanyl-D-alanine carboxypeptidase n=1 Tax=Cribrihabitans marinus TaxID=1227549 RepID=A0A1H7DXV8_9RHOB|nr:M15 family metallopeptidase [Cribrihabitans marinus]SEK03125.1 D-alanyl-D-alanine carboxypeptidase [Cribrihabitans marinus]
MRILPAIILAVAILLAPVLWYLIPWLFEEEDFSGPAIDSGARIEIEMLSQQVEDLRSRLERMATELSRVQIGGAPIITPDSLDADSYGYDSSSPNEIIDAYAQVVLIANRKKVNNELQIAGPRFLRETFGLPRDDLSNECQSMTNPRLESKLKLEQVGPIRVRMLQPAIDSLRTVFQNIERTDPDLYARINTAGSLCVRFIRGSTSSASTHAYGLAVDLNIDGVLDTLGDGKTQLGLTILADFFRDEGWVWGAAWGREDSMHFEVSRNKLEEWVAAGLL